MRRLCRTGAAFREAIELGDERRVVSRRLLLRRGERIHDALDAVDRCQHHFDRIGACGERAVTKLAENVFRRVPEKLEPRQAEEAAGSLDRMHNTENVLQ